MRSPLFAAAGFLDPESLIRQGGLLLLSLIVFAESGLLIGFCQVMVLVACAVALATRVPMVVNVTACLVIYFLGHLTAIMTEVSRNSYALINFMAQLFDTILPGLDLFDVGTAIVRDVPLP